MLAVHTPAPVYPMIRNEQLDELQENHLYEICTWPAYYSDEFCMNSLRRNSDPNVVLYVALMNCLWTWHADAWFCRRNRLLYGRQRRLVSLQGRRYDI